ncbi:hypothetical protein BN434_2679 [Erwinia amylovora CFBP 2585]|nr:hypothetical protein BN434_2679 [Erwinia amylovora CFBP 2585]
MDGMGGGKLIDTAQRQPGNSDVHFASPFPLAGSYPH